jgi:hypothetical protein
MTIHAELVQEGVEAVPEPENANVTGEPAFPDALEIIAAVRAAKMEADLMEAGYREMASELSEWSETTFAAQAETLPNE